MALNGPENCHIERNPMNIYCNGTEKSIDHDLGPYPQEKVTEMKRRFFDEHMKEDLGIDNLLDFANEIIQVDTVENGVYFKVEDLHFGETKSVKKPQEKASIQPDITLTLSKPFANLGQSLYVADINQGMHESFMSFSSHFSIFFFRWFWLTKLRKYQNIT